MTQELRNAVRKILSNEKIYPYILETVDSDVDYFFKNICEIYPPFIESDTDRQANLVAFCFCSGLHVLKKMINTLDYADLLI